jgi:hypothetical protein
MTKVIHIEIAKAYDKKYFQLRIGDIAGSSEDSLCTKEDIIDAIKDELLELEAEK